MMIWCGEMIFQTSTSPRRVHPECSSAMIYFIKVQNVSFYTQQSNNNAVAQNPTLGSSVDTKHKIKKGKKNTFF